MIKINRLDRIKRIIFPSRKINIFVIALLFLGVISGSIFAVMTNVSDRELIIEKIKLFIENVNNNKIITIDTFTNSIKINIIYVSIIWSLGLTLVGIIVIPCVIYLKGFIFGFSLASFVISYQTKGLILSILYTLLGQIFGLLSIIMMGIYSIMFTFNIYKIVFMKKDLNIKRLIKNYMLIFLISLFTCTLASLLEVFIFPMLIKLLIGIFI